MQLKFRKYRDNIFNLQRAALKIQHWFFKKRQASKFIYYVAYPENQIKETPAKLVTFKGIMKPQLKPPLVKKPVTFQQSSPKKMAKDSEAQSSIQHASAQQAP